MILTAATRAQQVSPPSPPPAETAPVIELPPFEVRTEKDTGYSAQNTTSGSRLNTKLADTPAAISVFTKEFLEDIGATNIEDITAYSVNSDNNLNDGASAQLTNSDPIITIRGMAGGGAGGGNTGRFTNFFQSSVTQDTFNMERAELTRGPNSVLFGVGSPSGGFNVGTKKPDVSRRSSIATFRFGSWNEARGTLDVNQPIIRHKLGLRVNAMQGDRNDWRPFGFNAEERHQFNVRWQIARRTRVDVEYERGRREFANASRTGVLDSLTPWIAAGRRLDAQVGQPFPANAGIQVLTTGNSLVYDMTSGTVYNVARQSVSSPAGGTPGVAAVAGEENPNIFDFGLVPRATFLGGPGYGTTSDYDRTLAVVSHELVQDLFLEAAFNRELTLNRARDTANNRVQVDTNAFLPNGAPNPQAGRTYVETQITLRDRTADAKDLRLSASYDLKLAERAEKGIGRWLGHHRLAALYLRRDADQQDNQQQESLIESPLNTIAPDNANNRIRRRTYFDLPGPVGLAGLQDFRQYPVNGVINQTDGRRVSTRFVPFGQPRDTRDLTTTNLYVWQASWLSDRLVTTVGYRKERVKTFQSTAVRTAPTAPFTQGILYPVRSADGLFTDGLTRTQGLVAKPFSWLSLFYNRSSSFNLPPRTVQILPGDFAPASEGETHDFGVKFPLFKDRLFATATYYETTASRTAANGGVQGYLTGLNGIWTTLANAGVAEAAGVTVFANGRLSDRTSNGMELELTANPTPQWRLILNFSANKTIDSNEASEIIAYYDQHNGLFTQGTRSRLIINGTPGQLAANASDPNDGVTTIAETLTANRADLQEAFINPNGVRQLGTPVAQANLRTNYSFREGRLRGFSAGGGARWRGERVVAYTTSDPATRQEIRGDDTITFDANLTYRRKLGLFSRQYDLTVQLNVNNLLDDDDLLINRVYANGAPRTFSFPDPRRWFVTTTVRF